MTNLNNNYSKNRKFGIGLAFILFISLCCLVLIGFAQSKTESLESFELKVDVALKGEIFHAEVARTPQALRQGLMYRTELSSHEGMLFPFSPPRRVDFWMKNCLIPLDMIFLKENRVVGIVHSAPPCQDEPCPTYPSRYPVDMVFEVSGGTANRLGLAPGDLITNLTMKKHPQHVFQKPFLLSPPEAMPEQF